MTAPVPEEAIPAADHDPAVELLRVAFANLPCDRAMRALLLADTGALVAWLAARDRDVFAQAFAMGQIEGWVRANEAFERAWKPVAASVRAMGNSPTAAQVEARREPEDGRTDHPGGPVPPW